MNDYERGVQDERKRWKERALELAIQADCEPHPWAKDWHPRQVLRFLVADVIDRPREGQ